MRTLEGLEGSGSQDPREGPLSQTPEERDTVVLHKARPSQHTLRAPSPHHQPQGKLSDCTVESPMGSRQEGLWAPAHLVWKTEQAGSHPVLDVIWRSCGDCLNACFSCRGAPQQTQALWPQVVETALPRKEGGWAGTAPLPSGSLSFFP